MVKRILNPTRTADQFRAAVVEAREARISLRLHTDLRAALEFLAEADRRKLSSYLEKVIADHAATMLTNQFKSDGSLDAKTPAPFRLRR